VVDAIPVMGRRMLTDEFFPIRFLGASVVRAVPFTQPLSVREMDLNRMAMSLSRNQNELSPFLQKIKRMYNSDLHLDFDLRYGGIQSIPKLLDFVKMMGRAGFLAGLKTNASRFTGVLADTAEARLFLSGGWLEQALRTDLISLHPKFGAMNVHVVFFDGTRAELDALAVWENRKFWFESTTGDIAADLKKIAGFHQILGIPRENCLVVTTGWIPASLQSKNVCGPRDLPAWMDARLPRYRLMQGVDWRDPSRLGSMRVQ
jgi:hypothetical protein